MTPPSHSEVDPPGEARATIVQWVRALGRWHTYSPRNVHAWFGLLWGLPVPVVATWIHLDARGLPLARAGEYLTSGSVPFALLLHPALFAVVFGAIGTVARDRSREIRHLMGRLRALALHDALTGLLNRRAFHADLARAVERTDDSVGLVLIDVDRFKTYNDTYGHPQGDALLVALAQRLRGLVRAYDVVYRYGGEEFAVLVPSATTELVAAVAGRIREGVAGSPLRLGPDRSDTVTVSVGASCRRADEPSPAWIDRVDTLLYDAKRTGRNRVCAD